MGSSRTVWEVVPPGFVVRANPYWMKVARFSAEIDVKEWPDLHNEAAIMQKLMYGHRYIKCIGHPKTRLPKLGIT